MKLKNILIVVDDIKRSVKFYHDLFGLEVVKDFGSNIILTEGLVLQEKAAWDNLLGKESVHGGGDAELYFEENNLDFFLERLRMYLEPVPCLNRTEECTGDCRVLRLCDPDGHIIEVKEV